MAASDWKCSFCGKIERPELLVKGPRVYICEQCVDLAADIVKQRREEERRGEST